MRRQHARMGVSQPRRQFFIRNLTGDVIREEGREHAITGLEAGDVGTDVRDGAAHVGAGDLLFEGVGAGGGFVVGVFAFCYYLLYFIVSMGS